jgi:DNA polymerase-3 subunit alpha
MVLTESQCGYAYLAFQTAYLKPTLPEHFYAAVLSSEAQDAAKVFKYSKELVHKRSVCCLRRNESNSGFTPLSGAISMGLLRLRDWVIGS